MGIFGKSKAEILATAFYKLGCENNKLDELTAAEAGANKKNILRESDYSVSASQANDKKDITKFDSYLLNYVSYFKGVMIWIGETIRGENFENLFDSSELKDIDEKNAVKALESKWKKFIDEPDLVIPNYSPSPIYYKKIDVCRYMEQDKRIVVQIRVGDFQYVLNHKVLPSNKIAEARGDLLDRDDQRFIQLQIAEANLK